MNTHIRAFSTQQADKNWHYVGATGEPVFQNSWVNQGTDWVQASFRKYPTGIVEVRLMVMSGTGNTVFDLPVGYRPTKHYGNPAVRSDYVGCRWQALSSGAFGLVNYGGSWISCTAHFLAEY